MSDGITIVREAPVQTRTVADIRITPAEAWAAFIGEDVSVLRFFELHKGYTLRGYARAMFAPTLSPSDIDAIGDLLVAHARTTSTVR